MSSRRSSSDKYYKPMIKLHRDSQIYRAVGGKIRGNFRVQYLITCVTIVFIILSGVVSLFGSETVNDFIVSSVAGSEKYQYFPTNSTSAPSLTPGQKLDRTWSDDKCRKEFPLLYQQLEANEAYWREKGGIKKEMIDFNEKHSNSFWGHTRLIIRNRKVYIRSFREGRETRNSAMVRLIATAVDSWPTSTKRAGKMEDDILPPIEIILTAGDKDTGFGKGGWAVTKPSDGREQGTWLLPDFGFISWPEAGAGYFEDFLEQAHEVEEEHPWSFKHDKMFWRGFPNFYAVRHDLMNRASTETNPSRREWSDIHKTTFHGAGDPDMVPLVTLPDHCKHKFLIHTEGNSYSGRSKYLFSCRSATIVHPLEWTQHFHPALNGNPQSPNQNYIQLQGPHFSGLEEAAIELRKADAGYRSKVQKYIGHKSPEKIADNAMRTLRDRYLSPASTMCYTRAALRAYSASLDVDSFGPDGISLIPGQGIAPDISKGKPMHHLKGDIEVGVWRLLGGPNWPPEPAPVMTVAYNATYNATHNSTLYSSNSSHHNASASIISHYNGSSSNHSFSTSIKQLASPLPSASSIPSAPTPSTADEPDAKHKYNKTT